MIEPFDDVSERTYLQLASDILKSSVALISVTLALVNLNIAILNPEMLETNIQFVKFYIKYYVDFSRASFVLFFGSLFSSIFFEYSPAPKNMWIFRLSIISFIAGLVCIALMIILTVLWLGFLLS